MALSDIMKELGLAELPETLGKLQTHLAAFNVSKGVNRVDETGKPRDLTPEQRQERDRYLRAYDDLSTLYTRGSNARSQGEAVLNSELYQRRLEEEKGLIERADAVVKSERKEQDDARLSAAVLEEENKKKTEQAVLAQVQAEEKQKSAFILEQQQDLDEDKKERVIEASQRIDEQRRIDEQQTALVREAELVEEASEPITILDDVSEIGEKVIQAERLALEAEAKVKETEAELKKIEAEMLQIENGVDLAPVENTDQVASGPKPLMITNGPDADERLLLTDTAYNPEKTASEGTDSTKAEEDMAPDPRDDENPPSLSEAMKFMRLEALPETQAEFRKHYKKEARERHPDKGGTADDFHDLEKGKKALERFYDEDGKLDQAKVKAAEEEEQRAKQKAERDSANKKNALEDSSSEEIAQPAPNPELSAKVVQIAQKQKEAEEALEQAKGKRDEASEQKKKAQEEKDASNAAKPYAEAVLDMLNDSYNFGQRMRGKALNALSAAWNSQSAGAPNSQNTLRQNTRQQNIIRAENKEVGDLDRALEDSLAVQDAMQSDDAALALEDAIQFDAVVMSPLPTSPKPSYLALEDAMDSYEEIRVEQTEHRVAQKVEETAAEKNAGDDVSLGSRYPGMSGID